MTIYLRPASEADLTKIVDVSTAAFPPEKDAIVRNLFPGDLHYSESIRKARIARKSVKFGLKSTVMMVAVDDDTIVGYAVWEVPVSPSVGNVNEDTENVRLLPLAQEGMDRAPFMELFRILEEDAQKQFGDKGTADVWSECFPSLFRRNIQLLISGLALDSLGVHPEHQKKGIGRMLLDWGVREASKQGRECYLVATPAGVPLYRSAGFEDVRIVDIFGTPHVSMRKKVE